MQDLMLLAILPLGYAIAALFNHVNDENDEGSSDVPVDDRDVLMELPEIDPEGGPVDLVFGGSDLGPATMTNGDDTLTIVDGAQGNDFLMSGGDDLVVIESDRFNAVDGGEGDDTIYAERGGANVSGGSGDDLFFVSGDDIWVLDGDGNDTVNISGGEDLHVGTGADDDLISGFAGSGFINPGEGNDTIDVRFEGGGTLYLNGAGGDDVIRSNYIASGDAGDDLLILTDGGIQMSGGPDTGSDTFVIAGERGALVTDFGEGDDKLYVDGQSSADIDDSGNIIITRISETSYGQITFHLGDPNDPLLVVWSMKELTPESFPQGFNSGQPFQVSWAGNDDLDMEDLLLGDLTQVSSQSASSASAVA